MTGAEILVAKATAKTVIALFKKWHAGYRLDKDIDEVFNRAFDRCPDVVMTACHKDRQFREMLFSLAISKSVDAGKLLEWATVVAAEVYDRAQVCQQLFDFSNELLDQCSVLKRKEAGRVPTVCADFKEQMNILLHGGRANQAAPPEAKQAAPPVYIPHRPNPLLRHYKSWLKQIEAALRTGAAVVNQLDVSQGVALHGQGGLGKTAMAVEYAHRYQDRYPGGVFWVQADQGLGQALAEVATNLGWPMPAEATDQQIIASVLPRLRTQEPKLVVLDNLDDKVVPREIETLPASQLLVTTRLSEVSVGQPVTMGLPTEEEALGIFLAYAGLEGQELSEAQQEAAYEVCRRAGFLPVALEILGKNARKVALVDLARALDQAVTQKSTVGTKGQELTIAAALAVTSHNYSHPRAKEALMHLAYLYPEELDKELLALIMFAGMGEDAPENAVDEAQAMLAALAEFSVVQPKPGGSGYTMHRLVQEAARLEDEGQKAGERVVMVLDAAINAISESGAYKNGYPLIPHLTHIAGLSTSELREDDFPSYYAMSGWAEFLWQSGRHQASDEILAKVQVRVAVAKGVEHPDYATLINNRATQKREQGNYREAENLFRQAMEIGEKTIGKEHPNYAINCGNLAGALESQEKYGEAEPLRRLALDIHQTTLGDDHPHVAIGLNNLALVLEYQDKFTEAEDLYRRALDIDKKSVGEQHPQYASHLNNLAGVLRAQGQQDEAEPLYRRAVDICLRTLGPEHPHTLGTQQNLEIILNEMKSRT